MLTETQMHDALATADLDAAIALLQAPAQYRAMFKDDQGGVRLAYDRETMVCFPLRLSTADRDRLFRHGGFALLPSKHWHDHDALREVMQGSAYLEWLDARPLYLSQVLTCALEELASPPWVRALLAHGYPVSADADALGDDHDFN